MCSSRYKIILKQKSLALPGALFHFPSKNPSIAVKNHKNPSIVVKNHKKSINCG
jgi:hypothetical protein